MGLDSHYKTLVGRAQQSVETLFATAEQSSAFTSAHNFSQELDRLIEEISERPEHEMLTMAAHELNYALYAAATGSYRHAHISLRLFFELYCSAILFSAHEIKLRSWMSGNGDSDVSWGNVVSPETGIYSTNFLKAFHPELVSSARQYLVLASTVYRECSEFVHGNVQTNRTNVPLGFDQSLLSDWIGRLEAVRLCVLFAFAARYLLFMKEDVRERISDLMMDAFGHLPAVQTLYMGR